MQDEIKAKFHLAISIATIARGCHKLKFEYKPPKHRQLLNETQKQNRISFAMSLIEMVYSDSIDLSKIVFNDESRNKFIINILRP